MKRFNIVFSAAVMLLSICKAAIAQTAPVSADSASAIVGKWTGSYDGSDSGNFELVIRQGGSRKIAGQITMLPADGSRNPIDLKTVTWQNGQLAATYTDPQNGGDVSFTGKFDQAAMKGSWQADGGQATGTWQLSRANR